MDKPPRHRPSLAVPIWHPLLRTASLLRLGRQEVDDLMGLADAVASVGVERPMVCSPQDVAKMVAADLWQCHQELEIFVDLPTASEWEAFRVTRSHLAHLVGAMRPAGADGPGLGNSYDPLRSLAALRLEEPGRSALARLGGRVAEFFETNSPSPRLVDDLLHAVAAGVHADLDYLLSVLRQQLGRTGGSFQEAISRWVGALERDVEVLRQAVPSIEEEDQEVTWTDIPVPQDLEREGEG